MYLGDPYKVSVENQDSCNIFEKKPPVIISCHDKLNRLLCVSNSEGAVKYVLGKAKHVKTSTVKLDGFRLVKRPGEYLSI